MSDPVTPDVPEEPAVVEETPAAPAEVESEQVDIESLPQAAQDYIHELREEAKDRRKENEPYKNAFSAYNEAEQEYLLNLVTTLAVDQEAGAKVMHELSSQLLGIEEAGEAVLEDPEVQKEAEDAGLSREELVQAVRAEIEQEKMFASIEAETKAVGFEPGTEEAGLLWDLAVALDEMDLSKVAPIARQRLGIDEPAAEEAEAAPEEPKEVLQAEDVNPVEYPKTAVANQGTAGTNAEDRPTPPKLGSDELDDRVRRRIEAMSQPGQ